MITKAIITDIIDDYHVKVRIPIINKAKESASATPDSNLYTALISCVSGSIPAYRINDVVYLGFEEEEVSRPVVLGLLKRAETKDTLSDGYFSSINVNVNAKLPKDTVIGAVSASQIQALSNVKDDIQGQIDIINEKIGDANTEPVLKRLSNLESEMVTTQEDIVSIKAKIEDYHIITSQRLYQGDTTLKIIDDRLKENSAITVFTSNGSIPTNYTLSEGKINLTFVAQTQDILVGVRLDGVLEVEPTVYTRLEYIESTGTQYIDTLVNVNNIKGIDIAFEQVQMSSWGTLYGINGVDKVFELRNNGTTSNSLRLSVANVTTTHNFTIGEKYHLSILNGEVKVNNELLKTYTSTYTYTNNKNITLYQSNTTERGWYKIYSCKLFSNNDGTLIRDFIPVKRDDGTIGLLDLVENKFYKNNGTGEFIPGPEINN